MHQIKFIFSLFTLFSTITVLSQGIERYYVKPVQISSDRTVTNIRETIQDNYGYLWVGTQDGLFRYGSQNTANYVAGDYEDKNLMSPDVRSIVTDSLRNRIWICSNSGGISIINSITGKVEYRKTLYYNGNIIATKRLCIGSDKVYLASNSGVFSLNKISYELRKLEAFDETSIENLLIVKGKLVAFTSRKGMLLYDPQKSQIIQEIQLGSYSSTKDIVYFEAKEHDNEFYVATSDGIKGFQLTNHGIVYNKNVFDFLPSSVNKNAFGLCIDKEANVWFSNSQNVIKIIKKNKKYSIVKNAVLKDHIEWTSSVYTIFCDTDNNIWLGSQQGLAYLQNYASPIQSFSSKYYNSGVSITQAYYIFPQSDTVTYICAENGLYVANFETRTLRQIDHGVAYDYFYTDNLIGTIISNTNGLFLLKRHRKIAFETVYREFESIGKIRINSVVKLGSKYILGTENHKGIIIWDFKNRKVKHYDGINSLGFRETVINNVVSISNDEAVILGDTYISIFNTNTNKNQEYITQEISKNKFSIFFDIAKVRNHYYVGSYGNGILVLDSNFSFKSKINTDNGLSNNGVYKLLPWADSLLFITTNNGLNYLNVSDGHIKQLYEIDGLHSNIFEETSGNVLKNKIYAGGKEGISVINPEYLNRKVRPPYINYQKLRVELSSSNAIDTFNLNATEYIIPNNSIQTTISFVSINYINPERTIYQYNIKEQSSNWINLNTQNFITLIGLAPGTYHLQVKAANEDGVWSDPKELVLIFLPKWYQTWWFYAAIVLLTAGILYALYRYRIAQIKKQHQIRKNIATDLHDDLGSTLNSVKVFTNLAISGVKQEESLQQVKDNLTEATMSLRDMIWVLDDSLDTVDELVTRLKQFAIPVATASNIETIITAGSDVNSRTLTKEEKRNLFLICKEAVNNSIKYSGASQIKIDIQPAGKKIQITIADNGKGFDETTVKKGYGLKNMQYRAGQVKYTTQIASTSDKGTIVFIAPV